MLRDGPRWSIAGMAWSYGDWKALDPFFRIFPVLRFEHIRFVAGENLKGLRYAPAMATDFDATYLVDFYWRCLLVHLLATDNLRRSAFFKVNLHYRFFVREMCSWKSEISCSPASENEPLVSLLFQLAFHERMIFLKEARGSFRVIT